MGIDAVCFSVRQFKATALFYFHSWIEHFLIKIFPFSLGAPLVRSQNLSFEFPGRFQMPTNVKESTKDV